MTTEEDELFLNILKVVGEMNLNEEETEIELMTQFARMYKSKIDSKEWKEKEFSTRVQKAVRYYIPEEYL